MIQRKFTALLFYSLALLPLLSGCSRFTYEIDILNYGERGVLLLQIGNRKADGIHPAYATLGVTVPIITGRFPGLPSKYRDSASSYGRLEGYEKSLPDDLKVAWQLAELTDCRSEVRMSASADALKSELRGKDYGRTEYVDKTGCMWRPLPEKVFHRTIDLKVVRSTDAYKRTGTRAEGVAGSRYTLNLTLIFIEEQVKIEVDNGATNPWL